MKKVLALLLCLLMIISLAACGSDVVTTGESQTSQVETENSNETTAPVESETPAESEEPESTEEPAVNGDWKFGNYVIPIPKPPVSVGPTATIHEEDSTYWATIKFESEELKVLTQDDISAYADELIAAGYNQIDKALVFEEIEHHDEMVTSFSFKAYKEDGISYVFMSGMIAEGCLEILVYVPMETQP